MFTIEHQTPLLHFSGWQHTLVIVKKINMRETGPSSHQYPQTYQDVLLQHPDMHPDLRAHVERRMQEEPQLPGPETIPQLTPTEHTHTVPWPPIEITESTTTDTIADLPQYEAPPSPRLTDITERLRQRWEHPPQIAETGGRPYFTPMSVPGMLSALEKGDFTDAEFSELISVGMKLCEAAHNAQQEWQDTNEPNGLYADFVKGIRHAKVGKLQSLYRNKDYSEPLKALLNTAEEPYSLFESLECVRKIYGRDSLLDLVTLENRDHLVDVLTHKTYSNSAIAIELTRANEAWAEAMPVEEASLARRDWGHRYLREVAGLPHNLSEELQFVAYSRTTDEEDPAAVNSHTLADMLARTANSMQVLGAEKAEYLRKEAGIINFDYYKPEQLLLMYDVLNGQSETIKHLRDGDVTVVFTDGQNDYNGAFNGLSEYFRTKNNRTLFFEVDFPEDFAHFMQLLNDKGIKPSTVVIGAHGSPGSISFGRGKNAFAIGNRRPIKGEEPKRQLMLEDLPLADIVHKFMQDSRGIDDDPGAIGRRRIILNSCQADNPTKVYRQRTGLLAKYLGHKRRKESTAETLAKVAGHANLEVIGAVEDLILRKTADGLEFRAPIDAHNDTQNRPQAVVSYRFNKHGKLVRTLQEDLRLRKSEETNVGIG